MDGTTLAWRKELLRKLGGITQPVVKNAERLYLFEEETRNSIMIEGYFTDKNKLKQVIHHNKQDVTHADIILGYYDAANLIYEYAYQKHVSKAPFTLAAFDITTIHSLMFKNIEPTQAGKRRNGDMTITGARVEPTYATQLDQAMRYFIHFVNHQLQHEDLITVLAQSHVLFESIHPFVDGNGRAGRVLLNYILVAHGFPNIIIKGTQSAKKVYFEALEQAESGLYDFLPDQIPKDTRTTNSDFSALKTLIHKALIESIDHIIITKTPSHTLQALTQIVQDKGYDPSYARKLAQRGKAIAKKINGQRHSHPNLIQR